MSVKHVVVTAVTCKQDVPVLKGSWFCHRSRGISSLFMFGVKKRLSMMQIREGLDYHHAVKEILQAVDWLKSTGAQKVQLF